jgi:hypothetical protein
VPLVVALGVWGQRWTRRELARDEADVTLLAWALERSVDAAVFDSESTVVRIKFTDQRAAKSKWWFVNRGDACELCLEDPG